MAKGSPSPRAAAARTRQAKKKQAHTLTGHLSELRDRLIQSLIVLVGTCGAALFFSQQLIDLVTVPVGELVFTAPTEGFVAHLKVSLVAGLIVALPYILWHVFAFVAPALEKAQRPWLAGGLATCLLLFYIGAAFAMALLGPGMEFFLSFGNDHLKPMIKVSEYYSFALTLMLGCGVLFEMPVAVWILSSLGILKPDTLTTRWKEALFAILILSAFVTPADPFTMIAMAVPLTGLYAISIWVARWAAPKA